MGPLDALLHLLNLFVPAFALAALAALLAKAIWWRRLAPVTWLRLALPSALVCAATTVVGLVAFGHDGRMATYGAMIALCALTLWWRGFGPGR